MKKKYYCTFLGKHADEDTNLCCKKHDNAYGINGTISRAQADKELRECLSQNGNPIFAWVVWALARCFGWAWYKKKDKV